MKHIKSIPVIGWIFSTILSSSIALIPYFTRENENLQFRVFIAFAAIISLSIVAIFVFLLNIKKHIGEQKDSLEMTENFTEGLKAALIKAKGRRRYINSLDIFAFGGTKYQAGIVSANIRIRNFRLLVSNKSRFTEEDWKNNTSGLIEKQDDSIGYLEFKPEFHFAIINNKYLFYGTYDEGEDGKMEANSVSIFSENSPLSKDIIDMFSKIFSIHSNKDP